MKRQNRTVLLAVAAVSLSASVALAQGTPKGPGPGMGGMSGMGPGPGMGGMGQGGMGGMAGMGGGRGPGMLGPGIMMGPGMMGMGGFGFSCNPRSAGMAEWRADRLEAVLKPNDAQKAKLADLKSASGKAAEAIAAACVTEAPKTPTERFTLMEKRLDAMQQAIKIVRPAFEAFYSSLDDKQKATLESAGPRRWGWDRWRWRWQQ